MKFAKKYLLPYPLHFPPSHCTQTPRTPLRSASRPSRFPASLAPHRTSMMWHGMGWPGCATVGMTGIIFRALACQPTPTFPPWPKLLECTNTFATLLSFLFAHSSIQSKPEPHVLPLLHYLPHQTATNVSLMSVSITTMLLPQTTTLLVSIHLGSRYEHVNVSRPQFGAMVFWRLMNTTNLCFPTVIPFELVTSWLVTSVLAPNNWIDDWGKAYRIFLKTKDTIEPI